MGPRNSSAIYRLAVAVVALLVLLSLYQQFFQSTQISPCGISNLSSTTATRQRSNFDSEKHDHWEAIDGDVLRNSDCGRQVPNYKPPSSASTLHQSDNSSSKLCNLEGPGPLPVILMTYGRSGSAVTWQAMSALAGGDVINAQEYTGMGPQDRINFFAKHIDETWAEELFCNERRKHPGAGIIGTKWKPGTLELLTQPPGALGALVWMREHADTTRLVRTIRNPLDVQISTHKHKLAKQSPTQNRLRAHCDMANNERKEACVRDHLKTGTGMELKTDGLVEELQSLLEMEQGIDRFLKALQVPFVSVTYEDLYYPQDGLATTWMQIFGFLGIGPSTNLTMQQVENAITMMPTHGAHHNETLSNYEEVKQTLEDGGLEAMLEPGSAYLQIPVASQAGKKCRSDI